MLLPARCGGLCAFLKCWSRLSRWRFVMKAFRRKMLTLVGSGTILLAASSCALTDLFGQLSSLLQTT